MAVFSRWARGAQLALVALSTATHGGCMGEQSGTDANAVSSDTAAAPTPGIAQPARVPQPIDAGEDGQSRNLLQHFIARDATPSELGVPRGRILELEAESWELPFKSKRIVAALLTVAARDDLEDLKAILSADATWGHPDARRPRELPIFSQREENSGEKFLAAFRRAAQRFDERADYRNPTNFMMGIQEQLRSGAEPMWAFYENGYDRILFRFIVKQGRARITYVGLYDDGEVPSSPPTLDQLGPPSLMTPPMRKEGGEISFGLPKQAAPRRAPG